MASRDQIWLNGRKQSEAFKVSWLEICELYWNQLGTSSASGWNFGAQKHLLGPRRSLLGVCTMRWLEGPRRESVAELNELLPVVNYRWIVSRVPAGQPIAVAVGRPDRIRQSFRPEKKITIVATREWQWNTCSSRRPFHRLRRIFWLARNSFHQKLCFWSLTLFLFLFVFVWARSFKRGQTCSVRSVGCNRMLQQPSSDFLPSFTWPSRGSARIGSDRINSKHSADKHFLGGADESCSYSKWLAGGGGASARRGLA